MTVEEIKLDNEQHIEVKADIGEVFKGVLHRFGAGNTNPNGESLQMILEHWPGGRWFRDRGNGIGHLWGHVQVIKPPTVLELSGPMFMSYPALNHVEVRLDQTSGGTRVTLRHRAIGFFDRELRENVGTGWQHYLDGLRKDFS
ncbi:MAG: SRPBCC domain-containing protein [Bryobacteraceae bacterium]|nr:SRPBCC domain-containing protein [Bryobacteraceae bacterium]